MTVSEESDRRLTFGLYVKHGGGIKRSAPMDSRRGCGRVVYYNWHHHIKVHQARNCKLFDIPVSINHSAASFASAPLLAILNRCEVMPYSSMSCFDWYLCNGGSRNTQSKIESKISECEMMK